MTAPEKSSDEILQELFGLCTQGKIFKTEESSQDDNSDQSNNDVNDIQKKHKRKKKKKKHKKGKKRRSSSADSNVSDNKSLRKLKKKRSHDKESDLDYPDFKKIALKVKSEKENCSLNSECKQLNYDNINNEIKSKNYMDTVTGKTLTIDDVFNSLGIPTDSCSPIKIKKEKVDPDYNDFELAKRKGMCVAESDSQQPACTELQLAPKTEKEDTLTKPKSTIADVFSDNETKGNENIDQSKTSHKKINIKNLKNSIVYEATIKEIEKREKLRAEKYEEGEISSSTTVSDFDSFDDSNEKGTEGQDSLRNEHRRTHKHKKRSKSRDESKVRHSRHCKKHRRKHKHNDRNSKSLDKDKSLERDHRKSKSESKHRHHQRHHHHDHYHARSLSQSSRSSSVSSRSHNFRNKKRKQSRENSQSRSRSRVKLKQRRSKSRSKSKSVEKIDKQKLLEIARKNAINLLKQGALPASVIANKDKIASIKAGGKTVDELTDFCKQLSKKDAEGQDSISSETDIDSDDERGKPFHHPFQIKERPASIVMNIRNAVPLPTKTAQEKTLELSKQLSLQYPVSSGQQHRKNESEWVPVVRTHENAVVAQTTTVVHAPVTDPKINVSYPIKAATSTAYNTKAFYPTTNTNHVITNAIMPPQKNIDISTVVAQRLEAIRRLSENPQDPIGNTLIQTADSKMQVWAESKVQPGLFTGSTGVRPLTAAELASGCKAWPRQDQFTAAKPVYSDKGEALMKKMGWMPGEGLGKYKQGPATPCEISMKTDRKGLAEQPQPNRSFKQPKSLQKAFEITQSKHPVSLLNEYCSRKKIGVPQYDCEEKEGAGKRKLFLFSVTVQGISYVPKMPSTNKKQSKVEAATICLQSLGLLPINPSTSS